MFTLLVQLKSEPTAAYQLLSSLWLQLPTTRGIVKDLRLGLQTTSKALQQAAYVLGYRAARELRLPCAIYSAAEQVSSAAFGARMLQDPDRQLAQYVLGCSPPAYFQPRDTFWAELQQRCQQTDWLWCGLTAPALSGQCWFAKRELCVTLDSATIQHGLPLSATLQAAARMQDNATGEWVPENLQYAVEVEAEPTPLQTMDFELNKDDFYVF